MSMIIKYMMMVLVLVLLYYVGKTVYTESVASANEEIIISSK